MGWEHSHLHLFQAGETRYGEPDPEYDDEMKDERRVKLQTIAREKGASFIYEYDFGDGWRHRVTVEDIWPRTENSLVPRCLDGKRACPPEDCGGNRWLPASHRGTARSVPPGTPSIANVGWPTF
jgi:hypothetical protein